jgi:CMP/dCMP kinase
LVIAIDGPSGAGKSTAGRALARKLGYVFIDTGAMYRAVALAVLRAGVIPGDAEAVAKLTHALRVELTPEGGVLLNGQDVSAQIRTREVSAAASQVSVHPPVRRELVRQQRALGAAGGVVLDGRDIGTAVFPDADLKFYVDADPARRAARRHGELQAVGATADLRAIEREIRERDLLDMSRADSPLTRAADAVLVDTSGLSADEVLERLLTLVQERQRST